MAPGGGYSSLIFFIFFRTLEFFNLKTVILQKEPFDDFSNFSRELSEELPEDPRNDEKVQNPRACAQKREKRLKPICFTSENEKKLKTHMSYEGKREKCLKPTVSYERKRETL